MTKRQNRINKSGVFYRTNGRWAPLRDAWTGKQRTFTSSRELNRYLNSYEFNYDRNYVLKSRITIRTVSA